jgi:hypothetical protein
MWNERTRTDSPRTGERMERIEMWNERTRTDSRRTGERMERS